MHTETRAEVLAALREVYDGSWTWHRHRRRPSFHWGREGGLVFACTGVIDSYYAVIGNLGDRFLLNCMAPAAKGPLARALKHDGAAAATMRKELSAAVAQLFAGRRAEPRAVSPEEFERIERAVALIVRLRGAVERDRRTRELGVIFGQQVRPASGSRCSGCWLASMCLALSARSRCRWCWRRQWISRPLRLPPMTASRDGDLETADVAIKLDFPPVPSAASWKTSRPMDWWSAKVGVREGQICGLSCCGKTINAGNGEPYPQSHFIRLETAMRERWNS